MSEERGEKKVNKSEKKKQMEVKNSHAIELNDDTIVKASCVYKKTQKCLRYKT